jgi:hypothetical protein
MPDSMNGEPIRARQTKHNSASLMRCASGVPFKPVFEVVDLRGLAFLISQFRRKYFGPRSKTYVLRSEVPLAGSLHVEIL